ncbi:unnamed protein product [Laminaria digitata]
MLLQARERLSETAASLEEIGNAVCFWVIGGDHPRSPCTLCCVCFVYAACSCGPDTCFCFAAPRFGSCCVARDVMCRPLGVLCRFAVSGFVPSRGKNLLRLYIFTQHCPPPPPYQFID